MASIRITQFGGLVPDLAARLKPETHASIAHNCVLDNGTLRPQAKWVRQSIFNAGLEPIIKSIGYDRSVDRAAMYISHDVVLSPGEPFPNRLAYGATLVPAVSYHNTGQGLVARTVAVYNNGLSGTVLFTPALLSKKPVSRVYAASRVRYVNGRREEGGLCALYGDPLAVVYEGDVATIDINISVLDDGITHVRIYRSLSGLDTGEEVSNTLDTEWHLIDEVPVTGVAVFTYVDGGSLTTDPLDVNFSQQFHPPELIARYFGLTESGWFTAVSDSGVIQVSERYMPHAWPSENTLNIQERITDAAVFMDNLFLGTESAPYIVSIAQGDKGPQLSAVKFSEEYPCLPGSMTPSASGVIYASPSGLVALSREGLQLITGGLVNPGDKFYTRKISAEDSPNEEAQTFFAGIPYTNHGAYLRGKYYGFCGGLTSDVFYLTSQPYPYYMHEEMQLSAALLNGLLQKIILTYDAGVENIELEAALISGELRPILLAYDMGVENMQLQAELVAGELKDILLAYDAGVENMQLQAAVVSGELKDILVQYTTAAPENMQLQCALIAGTLG